METNLSEVFGGKAHAFEKPIGLTEKITDIDSKIFGTETKMKTNMINMKTTTPQKNINKLISGTIKKDNFMTKKFVMPKMNINNKLPKNIKSMKMPSMNQKLPKNFMNMKMPSMNSKLPKNFMNMKMPSMNQKLPNMKMPKGMNTNLPKNMLGGFSSNKFKMVLGQVENKALNNIIRGPEQVANKRMKQQKGLPMFGDFDGDKVLNAFDCNPRDKKKQAEWHKRIGMDIEEPSGQARNLESGRYISPTDIEGEYQSDVIESKTEDVEVMEDSAPKLLSGPMEEESEQKIIDITPKTNGKKEEGILKKISGVAKEKLEQVGDMMSPQEPQDMEMTEEKTPGVLERFSRAVGEKAFKQPEKKKRERTDSETKEKIALYKLLAKGAKQAKGITKRTAMGMRASATFAGSQDTAKLLGVGVGPKLGLLPLNGTGSGFAMSTPSYTGQGISQLSALSPSSQGLATGYLSTTGQGLKLGYLPSAAESLPTQPTTPGPVAQPTPTATPTPTVQAPTPTPEKKIYSPYSKRRVTYTRGPYKK